jgi:hypothetical protein
MSNIDIAAPGEALASLANALGPLMQTAPVAAEGWTSTRALGAALAFIARQPVDRRPPTQTDDASKGYGVGNIWVTQDRQVYRALRVTTGAAAWQRQPSAIALAGDIASGLAAAFGIRKLVSAYSGPGLQVTRTSDNAALDIGFRSDGSLDTPALDKFLLGTVGKVSVWYDQSGNGQHATSGTNLPNATAEDFFGSDRGVLFDHQVTFNAVGGKVKQSLVLPTSLTANSNALSVVSLASFAHVTRNSPIIELSPATGQTAAMCFGNSYQNGVASLAARFGASWKWLAGYRPPMNAVVTGFSSSASNLQFWGEDSSSTSLSPVSGTALAGGLIGGTTLFTDGNGDPDFGYNVQGALLIFSRGITASEYLAVMTSLYAHHRLCPQARDTIVVDGDSITEGAFATDFQSWPRRLMKMSPRPARVYNVAISGGNFASQTQATQIARWVPQLYKANLPSLTLLFGTGSNDLQANGGTAGYAATMTGTSVPAYLAAVRAAGWQAPILIATILPRSNISGQRETERQAYNTTIRSASFLSANGLAGVSDVAADPTFAAPGASEDAALYQDGTHLTNLGTSYDAAAQMRALAPRLAG